jgi:8-oxo-dGTP diphosphatase
VNKDWTLWRPTLQATLMFVVDRVDGRVLLIRKKRGLGAGKINGPGGKMDPGETPLECAVRETQEELGVTAIGSAKHGELWFDFTDGLKMLVHVFLAEEHEGIAQETCEAVPLWTSLDRLPFEEMWEDDRFWLEELLTEGAVFAGRFSFDGEVMVDGQMEWGRESWAHFLTNAVS